MIFNINNVNSIDPKTISLHDDSIEEVYYNSKEKSMKISLDTDLYNDEKCDRALIILKNVKCIRTDVSRFLGTQLQDELNGWDISKEENEEIFGQNAIVASFEFFTCLILDIVCDEIEFTRYNSDE